ncbi:MAG TPA: SDR family oxidoreductase [Flavobacteriales bacterium]|nr:SDR family oxidoreductase [Flavobacteriales bacterium]
MSEYNVIKESKILVTGGAGFIGSNLCENLLQNGNQVVCFDNFSTGKRENINQFLKNSDFNLIEGDIRNLQDCQVAIHEVDIVLHQAALGSIPRSIEDPITTNEVNINGFLNMLIVSSDAGVKRFVYACSSSTYGDHPDLPKVENIIGRPLSPYAITKYTNELYAKVFSEIRGLETIGLRYFNVFGPRQATDGAYAAAIPKFVKNLINHESPIIYGDGEQSRDFTYIENVIQMNNLAATTSNKKALNEIYNVAYGDSSTINELLSSLRDLLSNFDKKINEVVPDYQLARKGEVRHSLASIKKGETLLEYQPRFSLSQGLSKAIPWYWDYFANNK